MNSLIPRPCPERGRVWLRISPVFLSRILTIFHYAPVITDIAFVEVVYRRKTDCLFSHLCNPADVELCDINQFRESFESLKDAVQKGWRNLKKGLSF